MRADDFLNEGGLRSWLWKLGKDTFDYAAGQTPKVKNFIDQPKGGSFGGRVPASPDEATHVYRNMNPDELEAARKSGYFEKNPNPGKTDWDTDKKYWSQGDTEGYFGRSWKDSPDNAQVRLPQEKLPRWTAGKTGDAEVLDKTTGAWNSVKENTDHDQSAVEELRAALLAKQDQLQSATDDQVYNIIDRIMTRIAKSHNISGKKLHDMWVRKYRQIPDTWIMKKNFANGITESKTVEYEGLTLKVIKQGHELTVDALDDWGNKVLGHVKFNIGDGRELDPQDLEVDDRYQGQGIARVMYDYVKSLGYTIVRSYDQTDAGAGFWDKHRGKDVRVWESFDRPYPVEFEHSEYGDVDALTRLPDGTYLSIMFNQESGHDGTHPGHWSVEFYRNNSQEVTGEGDAQKVFATVIEAIRQFVIKMKPGSISFSASKEPEADMAQPGANVNPESRAKLYNRLVQRYAGLMGYSVQQQEGNGKVTYTLKQARKGVAEGRENVEHFNGLDFSIEIEKDDEYVDDDDTDNQTIYVKAFANGRELGHVLFTIDYDGQGMILEPQDLEVDERFQGQGIAATMYDYVKSKGYRIRRSGQQTDAGAGFWNKHRPEQNVWEQGVAEARTNPDKNIKRWAGKLDLAVFAKNIKDKENWGVSMTVEPKLGINPRVGISEDTPKGIYFYPLEYFIHMVSRYTSLPWGDNMPYMQLFQYDRSGEMTRQTQVDPAQLKQALSQYCPEEIIQQVIDEPDSLYDGTPYWIIYDCLSRLGKSDETNIIRWNKVLRDLGFTSVFDPGRGWIATGEPTQGIILDPRIIKQHKTFINRNPTILHRKYDINRLADAINWSDYYNSESQRQQVPYGHPDRQKTMLAVANNMLRPFLGKTSEEAKEMGLDQALKTASDKVIEILKQDAVQENFADGKNPGRKGLAKRSGVNTKASVSSLRKTAKNSSGEKQRMAHWLANMKSGRNKNK